MSLVYPLSRPVQEFGDWTSYLGHLPRDLVRYYLEPMLRLSQYPWPEWTEDSYQLVKTMPVCSAQRLVILKSGNILLKNSRSLIRFGCLNPSLHKTFLLAVEYPEMQYNPLTDNLYLYRLSIQGKFGIRISHFSGCRNDVDLKNRLGPFGQNLVLLLSSQYEIYQQHRAQHSGWPSLSPVKFLDYSLYGGYLIVLRAGSTANLDCSLEFWRLR